MKSGCAKMVTSMGCEKDIAMSKQKDNLSKVRGNESAGGEILLYQTEDGETRVEVRLRDETVWLSQKQMAELFQTSVPNINMHIKNIFDEGELRADSVIQDFLITAADGKKYRTKLKPSGRDILDHAGSVSHQQTLDKAHGEYEQFRLVHLNDTSSVEKHFLAAVSEVKQIEQGRKNGR